MPELEPLLVFVEFFKEGGSEKHLRGIRGILNVSRTLVDFPELERWVRLGQLDQVWQRVQELPL